MRATCRRSTTWMVRFSGSLHFVTTGAMRHAEGNGQSP